MPKIEIIAAISENNCIGKDNKIPWHISEDLKRVARYTTGKCIIMGHNTWLSIPEKYRPLPNRTNIVITQDETLELPEGVEKYTNIPDAIAAHPEETMVGFGGQGIYTELLPQAETLYITHVPVTIEGGHAFFPQIMPTIWEETHVEEHKDHTFVIYKRIKK